MGGRAVSIDFVRIKVTTTLNWLVSSRLFLSATLLAAIGLTTALGVLGAGHGGVSQTNPDMRILYLAGVSWHDGVSAYSPPPSSPTDPWLQNALARYDFAYPPQIAPFSLLLATFSPAGAKRVMTGVNIASAVILAVLCVHLARGSEVTSAVGADDASGWLIPAVVLGNFSTAFVIWAGQTTLIVTAALMLGWYDARRDRWLRGGILLAISTIKPQLSFLAIFWLVLERRWRTLAVAGLTILLFAAIPMIISGPLNVVVEWFAAAQAYANGSYNLLGSRMVFGLRNLLHVAGITAPSLLPAAIMLCGVLWYFRSSIADEDILAMLVSVSLLCGFTHSYDLAALMPLVPAFWRHLHAFPNASVVALVLMLFITVPNSLFEPLDFALLCHARVFALLAALIWLVALSIGRASSSERLYAGRDMRPQAV